jgi:hypothetical protein
MFKAKDIRNIDEKFLELLESLPGNKQNKHNFFLDQGRKVAKTNYEYMLESLKEKVGRINAAKLIFDYLNLQFLRVQLFWIHIH